MGSVKRNWESIYRYLSDVQRTIITLVASAGEVSHRFQSPISLV
jgi:hypothetical protein